MTIDRYVTAGEEVELAGCRWTVLRTVPGASAWKAELLNDAGRMQTVAMPPAYTPGRAAL